MCVCAAPVLSCAWPINAPTSGAAPVTVSGLQFGASEASATLWLAVASCSTASWTSSTSARCTSVSNPVGQVGGLRIAVAAVLGTGSSILIDADPTPGPTASPTLSPTEQPSAPPSQLPTSSPTPGPSTATPRYGFAGQRILFAAMLGLCSWMQHPGTQHADTLDNHA